MNELTGLAEWTVPDEEIDHLGHMSTLFYAHRANQAALRLLETLGAGPADLAAAGLVAAVVDRHTLFRREQLARAPLTLAGGVAGVGPQRLDVYAEMANAATGDLAATFNLGVEVQRRDARTPADMPSAWRQAAAAWRIEPPARSHPRTLPLDRMGADLTAADLARIGIAPHLRREILPEECDADGVFSPPPPRLVAKNGVYNQGIMDQVWGTVPGFAWPALEMRTLAPRTPRQGDVLETYSALLSVGHKVMQSGFWTFDARSGALVAVMQQVNIFFDLAARRAQDMPAEVRERLTRLATPGLVAPRAR